MAQYYNLTVMISQTTSVFDHRIITTFSQRLFSLDICTTVQITFAWSWQGDSH